MKIFAELILKDLTVRVLLDKVGPETPSLEVLQHEYQGWSVLDKKEVVQLQNFLKEHERLFK